MDSRIEIGIVEWRGDFHTRVVLAHRQPGRRFPVREYIWSGWLQVPPTASPEMALEAALAALTAWQNAGFPRYGRSPSGAPRGATGGGTGQPCRSGDTPTGPSTLNSGAPTPQGQSGAEGVSDGLVPEGHTPPLF